MKVWLEINRANGSIEKRNVDPQGHVGVAIGACPGCNVEAFVIVGGNRRIENRDTYKADGRCKQCGDAVGHIYAKVDTFFGIEEDERVLHGRARVYY